MLGFARKKERVEDFEKLAHELAERKWSRAKGVDFDLLCSSLKTSRLRLDNMLYDSVGMSGDDILSYLRRRKPMISD